MSGCVKVICATTSARCSRPRQTAFADRLVDVRLRPAISAPPTSPEAAAAWAEVGLTIAALQERLRAIPGVEATVLEYGIESALGSYIAHPDDRVPGGSQEVVRLSARHAAPGYLAAMGIPFVRGRDFELTEVAVTAPRDANLDARRHAPAIALDRDT